MYPADPVFIHGILPRSGTNFLWDLLLLHPDCARAREPVNEDLFLDHSDPSGSVCRRRARSVGSEHGEHLRPRSSRQLVRSIGEGLVSFLWTDRQRRLVSKSPSVAHLERFFTFFPSARLLILVRDGRSVVQSAMDTFALGLRPGLPRVVGGARTRFIVFSRPNQLVRTVGGLVGMRISSMIQKVSCGRYSSSWGSMPLATISRPRVTCRFGDRRPSGVRTAKCTGTRCRRTRRSHRRNAGARGALTVAALRLDRRRTTRGPRLRDLAQPVLHD